VAAVQEAEAIAVLFPSVRPRGAAIEAFLADAAARVGETEDVSDGVLEDGFALLGEAECRRVVDSWAGLYADRWGSLTAAAGDIGAAERALVTGAIRAAVMERCSTPRELVEPLEGGALRRSPFAALALAIPPMFVWSRDEAGAGAAAAWRRRKLAERHTAIEQVAYALVTFEHLRRTRRLAAGLAEELPFEGLPVASELLAGTCRDVELDDSSARTASAALLIAYVEQIDIARRQ
jgi:hypothetical protein